MPESAFRGMSVRMRWGIALCFSGLMLAGLGYIFWQQQLQYLAPTPVPAKLVQQPFGTCIDLPANLPIDGQKPVLLHFFNPKCPCSRFNLQHLQQVVKRFGDSLSVVTVIHQPAELEQDARKMLDEWKLELPIYADTGRKLAKLVGVYSTPQAVLIDAKGQLYYRGNYNRSRYCTNAQTEYARMAVECLLAGKTTPELPSQALMAYGCPLQPSPVTGTSSFWPSALR